MRRLLCAAVAALCILPAAVEAAPVGATAKIISGQPASRDYPSQAYLEIDQGATVGSCGATVVAARYAITAAHCVTLPSTNIAVRSSQVLLGIGKRDLAQLTRPDIRDVTRIVVHPSYDPQRAAADVAVLTLAAPVLGEHVRLLGSSDGALWRPGTHTTIIGWGTTSEHGQPSGTLLEARIPIRDDADCARQLGSAYDQQLMFCAGTPYGPDTCQGDSGGPALVADEASGPGRVALAGVVSFGIGCGNATPGVYTRIAAEPIAGWLSAQIPQVNIAAPADPIAGRPFTLTAQTRNSLGYSTITWDLNGDGRFEDASGAQAQLTMPEGPVSVAAQAANAAGDAETRRVLVHVQPPTSPVTFAKSAPVTVHEGKSVKVTIRKHGAAAGQVAVQRTLARGQTRALLSPVAALTLASSETQATFTLSAPENKTDLPSGTSQTQTLTLTAAGSGRLLPAAPSRLRVRVVDNDHRYRPKLLSARVQGKALVVRARVRVAGRITVRAASARTLARVSARARKAGLVTVRVPLTSAGRRSVGRKAELRVTFTDRRARHVATARKKLTLRRG